MLVFAYPHILTHTYTHTHMSSHVHRLHTHLNTHLYISSHMYLRIHHIHLCIIHHNTLTQTLTHLTHHICFSYALIMHLHDQDPAGSNDIFLRVVQTVQFFPRLLKIVKVCRVRASVSVSFKMRIAFRFAIQFFPRLLKIVKVCWI